MSIQDFHEKFLRDRDKRRGGGGGRKGGGGGEKNLNRHLGNK